MMKFSLNCFAIKIKIILLIAVFASVSNFLSAQNLILWNGENTSTANCRVDYGVLDNTNAHSGNYCFDAQPDQYHRPVINMECQNNWRADLSRFNEIWFYAKANMSGVTTSLSFSAWPYNSEKVDISPYIPGGKLTTSYQLIKIPITAFYNSDYKLNSVEYLYLDTNRIPGVNIYIDDIMAMDTKPNTVTNFQFLSNKAVRLDISDSYDTASVKDISNYGISSTDDPNYSTLTNASQVGMHYYVTGFPYSLGTPNPYLKYELFLSFKDSLKVGKHYNLQVNNILDKANNSFPVPQIMPFVYLNQDSINGSVKVNQVGYIPKGPKYGYVGNFLGAVDNKIELMDIAPNTFEIRDTLTHNIVYSGIPSFRGLDSLSGEKLFECDFTHFEIPGHYYLYVPGVGRSYHFDIADNVYDSVYYKTMRVFYYQRCGIDLLPQFAGLWTHARCHQNDGVPGDDWQSSVLYNNESLTDKVDLTHGWHDAGDYGKYTTWASWPLFRMLSFYELFHEKFRDNELNIPESGNGVPDILDEVKWEIDWLRKMQAPDGGVYERVTSVDWPNTMPEFDNSEPRQIRQKTTFTTGVFAALMAQAYRNFHPYWPQYADECLVKAKKAWDFLAIHTDPLPAGGYSGPGGIVEETDQDERAWADIEMYKATGELRYRDSFDVHWKFYGHINPTFAAGESQQPSVHQFCATMAYATCTQYPVDQTLVSSMKNYYVKFFAEPMLIAQTDGNKYRVGTREDILFAIAWGRYAMSSTYAWDLIVAHYFSGNNITGDQRYLDYAKTNLNIQLGDNAQNTTYITGIGSKSPMDPLHHPSLHDNILDPVPGIGVFGPSAHMSAANAYDAAVQSTTNLYPSGVYEESPYPIFRRWNDIHANVMRDEFNVTSQGEIAMAFAYFKSAQPPVIRVSLKAYLQGASSGSQPIMRNQLQTLSLIPAIDPYNLNIKPSVAPNSTSQNIVDWIRVDLLDKNTKSIVSSKAAFMSVDGTILDTNYAPILTFTGFAPDQYYISISHRNHLGIVSANPLALSDINLTYDFTTSLSQALDNGSGNQMIQLYNGTWALWGGKANGNNFIKYSGPSNDENALLNIGLQGKRMNVVSNVYNNCDLNLDGNIDYSGTGNTDENFLLNQVLKGNKAAVIKGH